MALSAELGLTVGERQFQSSKFDFWQKLATFGRDRSTFQKRMEERGEDPSRAASSLYSQSGPCRMDWKTLSPYSTLLSILTIENWAPQCHI